MTQSAAQMWDERYGAQERVWRGEPHEELVEAVAELPPGTALDVAAGEGRHAIWLAEHGWDVTAVDFSAVGLDKGRAEAQRRGLDIAWVVDDVTTWDTEQRFDLIVVAFLHMGEEFFSHLRGLLAPGGWLVVVSHAKRNLTDGVGGPQNPDVLHDEEMLRQAASGLDIVKLAEVERHTEAGTAIDIVLCARSTPQSQLRTTAGGQAGD